MTQSLFAVSSCAFPRKTVAEVEKIGLAHDFIIEFSSGFPYEINLDKKFINAQCRRLIHNYFPTPETPFVLNLASLNKEIWSKSVAHGQEAIRLAGKVGIPFYTIHSGFCIDPKVEELGRKFTMPEKTTPRQKYWAAFLEALQFLLEEAEKNKVDLMVENNVTIKQNLLPNGESPFLCSAPAETSQLFHELNHPRFGLLLDTGHANVSANSLGFDKNQFVDQTKNFIKAIHHNDNEGLLDNNKPLTQSYWFLPRMPEFKEVSHIIEVNNLTPDQVKYHIDLLKAAMSI